jgi:hypothetical protein
MNIALFYTSGIYGSANSTSTYIVLTMTQRETLTETQKFTYDTNNFVADFGGFLGLLLGLSFLDMYNMAVGFGLKRLGAVGACR